MHEQPTQPKKENNTVRNTVAGVVGAGVAAFGAYKSADVPAAPSTEAKSSITTIGGNSERKFSPDQSGVYTIDVSGDACALTRVAGERRDTDAERESAVERMKALFMKPGSRYRTWIENEILRMETKGRNFRLRPISEGQENLTDEQLFEIAVNEKADFVFTAVYNLLERARAGLDKDAIDVPSFLTALQRHDIPEAMTAELLQSLSKYLLPDAVGDLKQEVSRVYAPSNALEKVADSLREYDPTAYFGHMTKDFADSIYVPGESEPVDGSVDIESRVIKILGNVDAIAESLSDYITDPFALQAARGEFLRSMMDNLQRMYEVSFRGLDPKSPHYANLVMVRDTVLRELRQDYLELVTGKYRK